MAARRALAVTLAQMIDAFSVVSVSTLATRLGADVLRSRLLGTEQPSLDHKYRLGRLLGRGATGVVMEGWDTRLGRRVAVKLSPCSQTSRGMANEGRALAQLRRPRNVVQVFDVGAGRLGTPTFSLDVEYVVMELIEGTSLRTWLVEAPRTQRDVLHLYLGVADGLAFVHEHGIVHGDVKPDNVLVTTNGTPMLVDFGFATSVPATGGYQQAVVEGTLGYMAPERLQGVTGKPCDVYAFAASLWEGMHGEGYVAPSTEDLLAAVKHAWRVAKYGSPLDRLLLDALQDDPTRRPPIDELRRELANLLRAQSTGVTPSPRPSRAASRRPSRFRYVLVAIQLFAVGLFANKRLPHWTERLPAPVGDFLMVRHLAGTRWVVDIEDQYCGDVRADALDLRFDAVGATRLTAAVRPRSVGVDDAEPATVSRSQSGRFTVDVKVASANDRRKAERAGETPTCQLVLVLDRTRTGFEGHSATMHAPEGEYTMPISAGIEEVRAWRSTNASAQRSTR